MNRSCLTIALILLGCAAPAFAEQVPWALGRSIEVRMPVATMQRALTRTVVLPASAVISEIPKYWTEDQFAIQPVRNTLVMQLKDPSWAGSVLVYDDKGNLYVFNVRAAAANEPQPDDLLVLKAQEPLAPAGGAPARTAGGLGGGLGGGDDFGVVTLMVHMVGGVQDSGVTGSLVTSVDSKGQQVTGRVIFEDDAMRLTLQKIYEGVGLRGYECVLEWRGEATVKVDIQRLWFPGALAVHASDQILYSDTAPGLLIEPKTAVRLWYVAGGGE